MHRLLLLLALIASLLLPAAAHANPIEPEKAFAMRAQALDAQTIEVVFEIAKDYYLYGDKFRDRKSTRLNSSHLKLSRMPSSA